MSRRFTPVRLLAAALAAASLAGCLFSGDDDVAGPEAAGAGMAESLAVERLFVDGTGADGLLERVRDTLRFQTKPDFAFTSYVSPYRNYWYPHLVLGKDADFDHVVYFLFDVTDTMPVSAGALNTLFLGTTDPDSLPLSVELPEDTAFARALNADTVLKVGAKADFSVSWALAERALPRSADSLRKRDTVFARELDESAFGTARAQSAKRVRDANGRLAWSFDLPRELSEELVEPASSKYRFVVLRVQSSSAPLRVVSPYVDTTKAGWRPRLKVGDWASRLANRSAARALGDDPTSLLFRGAVAESLVVSLPVDRVFDSIPADDFSSLRRYVVRARLALIPASAPVVELEGGVGAVPIVPRVTLDTGAVEKTYNYEEPQTGNFADTNVFPRNWFYAGAPERTDTLSLEITEAARRALRAGDARGVRVALHVGRHVIDTTINYLGSNQMRAPALDRIDLGDPASLKWRLEIQTVRTVAEDE